MPEHRAPSRISFNFADKCNLSCPFCYVPFDRKAGGLELWKRIIDIAFLWQVKTITFGGGDPFIYPDFPDLLRYTFEKFCGEIFIQVDTNGLCLKESHYQLLSETSTLLGLPLDGSTEDVSKSVRNNQSHHVIVLRHLESLQAKEVSLKINTLVCRQNIGDVGNVAKIVMHHSVSIWSLYEFWPIGPIANSNRKRYEVSHDVFLDQVSKIVNEYGGINIDLFP